MEVPKATMNKDGSLISGQYDVGVPWEVTPVQPEPESHAMKHNPHSKFGLSVLGADKRHYLAALFF